MKTLKIFFALLLFLALPLAAQTKTDDIKVIERAGGAVLRFDNITIDSADVIYSQSLDLTNYDDDSFVTYPVSFGYNIDKIVSSDSVNVSVEYWVCYADPAVNANWKVADTLFTAAVLKATAAPAVAIGTHDLNNIKAPYSKIKIRNNGTGSKAHKMYLGIYFGRRD